MSGESHRESRQPTPGPAPEEGAHSVSSAARAVGAHRNAASTGFVAIPCPFCGSTDTELMSLFGSSQLTSQYYCRGCRTAFERVRWGTAPGGVERIVPRP